MSDFVAETWAIFALWVVLLILSYTGKKPQLLTINSIYGFYLGWVLYEFDEVASLAFIAVNLFTLWESFDNWDHD